jgi:ketosteroid isomerase-like protein
MSQDNVEVVRRLWDEVGGKMRIDDLAARASLLANVSPNVELLRETGHPHGGEVLRGHEGLAQAMVDWQETLDDVAIELERLVDAGDKVVEFTRWSGRGKGSGAPFETQVIDVFTFERGEIVRWEVYRDPARALRAAGVEG